MAPKVGGGIKRSSWLTFRRRLLLVRTLLRGPSTSNDLVVAINTELGGQGYPQAATAALKHDLDALKGEYGCQISYNRVTRSYVLVDLGELALLDLPDASMEALTFLDASFPQGDTLPEHGSIRDLLERILLLLPPMRQAQYRRQRSVARMATSGRQIDSQTLKLVKRAIATRCEVMFVYLTTLDDELPRQHRVAPYTITAEPEGYTYLDATLLEVIPKGTEQIHAAIDYRLDRIIPGSVVVLSTMLPPQRIVPPIYQVRYTLVPRVARRRDVVPLFPATQISYRPDGSVEVIASTTNLWQAHQILLRYGDACIVHEPPQLVQLFQATAQSLCALYGATPNSE